jgi:hypothetical protein
MINIHDKNRPSSSINELDLDAVSNGDKVAISADINNNGKRVHFDTQLDGVDLAEMLNINIPRKQGLIGERLRTDFRTRKRRKDTPFNFIEIDDSEEAPQLVEMPQPISQLLQNTNDLSHMMSPSHRKTANKKRKINRTTRKQKKGKSKKRTKTK